MVHRHENSLIDKSTVPRMPWLVIKIFYHKLDLI